MRKDKDKAFELRKSGKSYREIRDEMRIPLATLSDWFRGETWSQDTRKRLTAAAQIHHTARIVELDKVRGEHLRKIYEEARAEAREDLKSYRYNPLFIAGLMLYWGEGDKATKSSVRLSNSDPLLVKLYVDFLEKVCRIPSEKIKAQMLIYPDIDRESNLRFWSFATGIPLSRFTKSVLIEGRHKTKKLGQGVCTIVVSNSYFKAKMLEWLKLFPQELMQKQYYENISDEAAIV